VDATHFDSEHTDEASPLPLISVRFKPSLDARGRAYSGIPMLIPVMVERVGSEEPVRVGDLGVDVSFNDGATWSRVPVKRVDKQWFAVVLHPKQGHYVSLRATARDHHGNKVEQTVIRAYGLKGKP
jgi:hypothetical protein